MRVLIVDDSVVFRTQISAALSGVADIEVVGTAASGSIALQKLGQSSIDVVTLDLEMPDMDGIQVLKLIREGQFPVKVIVFSSQTTKGAEKGIEALENGADDIVAKPNLSDTEYSTPGEAIRATLAPKILQFKKYNSEAISEVHHKSLVKIDFDKKIKSDIWNIKPSVIVIASSTGGPNALEYIFEKIKKPLSVPILIAQHMPPIFTEILARRISSLSGLVCLEAQDGILIEKGKIYVAPGDFHLEVIKVMDILRVHLAKHPQRNSVRPAADYLFETAAQVYGSRVTGIVLTGMGEDGLQGAKSIKEHGGNIFIQDKESCVVFGMPGAIFQENIQDEIGNLDKITKYIITMGE